ncbi:unnamed protein product, partial [Rotaria magnacalcarata]
MPPLPNAAIPRFPTSFPSPTLPNVNTSSAFNTSSAPPLPGSNTIQTSAFIGQQQFQPVAPPPQSGFYNPQSSMQQKSFI